MGCRDSRPVERIKRTAHTDAKTQARRVAMQREVEALRLQQQSRMPGRASAAAGDGGAASGDDGDGAASQAAEERRRARERLARLSRREPPPPPGGGGGPSNLPARLEDAGRAGTTGGGAFSLQSVLGWGGAT